jgi:hypothetical protein
VATSPFEMMTPRGFLADEGAAHAGAGVRRRAHLGPAAQDGLLMPRMIRAVPYLGYVVIAGTKSRCTRW